MLGVNSPRGTIRNFCHPNGSRESPILMYAIPLSVLEENLIGDVSRVSEMDFNFDGN